MTSAQLAATLEVTPRTILRDVDAMTEAGLPIIVFQGNQGGIELGFNYRTRLTGLDQAEAEALGVILGAAMPAIEALGMDDAARRAKTKLIESFPDKVRATTQRAIAQFQIVDPKSQDDPRIAAFAHAIRGQHRVKINAAETHARVIHPTAMQFDGLQWEVSDARSGTQIVLSDCGDLNVSAHRFSVSGPSGDDHL